MTLKLAKFTNLAAMLMDIGEFMQQDSRKERMARCTCVTNMTGLLLACSVVIHFNVFWSFTKTSV